MIWIDHLHSRLKEHSQLDEEDIKESLSQAFSEYNGYHQRENVVSLVSDGSGIFELPSTWDNEFSRIENVEYPLAEDLMESNPSGYPIPAMHETSDYAVHTIEDAVKLVVFFECDDGDTLRMFYSLPYSIDTAEMVPAHHQGALLNLATSYALAKLAAVYSQSVMYDIEAEAIDYKGRASEYLKQATWYRDLWEQMLGIGKYSGKETAFGQDIDDDSSSGFVASAVFPVDRSHRMFKPSYEKPAPNVYHS